MPSPLVRRSLWAIAIAALAVALAVAFVPFLASTRIVRDRIADELGSWSGYRVSIGAAPEIEVWPGLRAIVNNVTMTPWGQGDHPPVIEAERIDIKLSALAALRGDIVFSSAELVRPTLRLEKDVDGHYRPLPPDGGRIANAIRETAQALADSSADTERGLPPRDFGVIGIRDGRVTTYADGKDSEILTGATGRLDWPALNKSANAALSVIWRGETINLEISSAKPLLLLAGGEAPLYAEPGLCARYCFLRRHGKDLAERLSRRKAEIRDPFAQAPERLVRRRDVHHCQRHPLAGNRRPPGWQHAADETGKRRDCAGQEPGTRSARPDPWRAGAGDLRHPGFRHARPARIARRVHAGDFRRLRRKSIPISRTA